MKKSTLFILVLIGLFLISSIGVFIGAASSEPVQEPQENPVEPLKNAFNQIKESSNYTLDVTMNIDSVELATNCASSQQMAFTIKVTQDAYYIKFDIEESITQLYVFQTEDEEYDVYIGYEGEYNKLATISPDDFENHFDGENITLPEINYSDFTVEDDIFYGNLDKLTTMLQDNIALLFSLTATEGEFAFKKCDFTSFTIELLNEYISRINMTTEFTFHECSLGGDINTIIDIQFDYSRFGTTKIIKPTNIEE